MGSFLLLFLLFWFILTASIWVYFEDYYKNKDKDI